MAAATVPEAYRTEIETWRKQRQARLIAPDGWTTLVGLHWLKEGENPVGSDESNAVVLPGSAPARLGVITLRNGKATLKTYGQAVQVNGKAASRAELKSDHKGQAPDKVALGPVTFFIIDRAGKIGVRVRDERSPARLRFAGLRWYPVRPEWRISAKWVKYDQPKQVRYSTTAGIVDMLDTLGYAEFSRNGRTFRLEGTDDGDALLFVFRDTTAGKTTYPAARFLRMPVPNGNSITLDFNMAYNPPCVFTPYATCPLPQPGNRLPFAIPAGELKYVEK